MAKINKEKYHLFAKHNLGAFTVERFIKGGYDHLAYIYEKPTLEVYISNKNHRKLALEGIGLYFRKDKVDRLIKEGHNLGSIIKKSIRQYKNNFKNRSNSELMGILNEISRLVIKIGKIYRFTEVIYTGGVDEKIRNFISVKIKNQNEANYILDLLVNPSDNEKINFKREETINKLKIPNGITNLCESMRKIGKERLIFRSAINDILEYLFSLIHEVGRRNYLAFSQIEACFYREITNLIKGGSVDIDAINQRTQCFVALKKDKNYIFYTKEKARKIISEIRPKLTKNIRELKGDIASLGVATGKVKIILDLFSLRSKILLNQKIKDMKKGEILVTTTSGPEMIMACRKAGAIVADEGGINSHAAIISREFGIPGIVNAKIATQVLNDGDIIEVDANKGLVRIIKRLSGGGRQ